MPEPQKPAPATVPSHITDPIVEPTPAKMSFNSVNVAINGSGQVFDHRLYITPEEAADPNLSWRFCNLDRAEMVARNRMFGGFQEYKTPEGKDIILGRTPTKSGMQLCVRSAAKAREREGVKLDAALREASRVSAARIRAEVAARSGVPASLLKVTDSVGTV